MEDVLDLYEEDYEERRPVVCFDEKSYQMASETRRPLPMTPGEPERFDYEYKREGVGNLFAFFEPKAAWRHIAVTDHRTRGSILPSRCAGLLKSAIGRRIGSASCSTT